MTKKPEETIAITCSNRAYLAPLKTMGPIVTPVSVPVSDAAKLVLSGATVFKYDFDTKSYTQLTVDRLNAITMSTKSYSAEALKTPTDHEFAGIKIDPANPLPDLTNPAVPDNGNTFQQGAANTSTEPAGEQLNTTAKASMEFKFKEDGKVDESGINWSALSKPERYALRAEINKLNEAASK